MPWCQSAAINLERCEGAWHETAQHLKRVTLRKFIRILQLLQEKGARPRSVTSTYDTRECFSSLPEHERTIETDTLGNSSSNVSEVSVKDQSIVADQLKLPKILMIRLNTRTHRREAATRLCRT